jgi:hypothetical protein
MKKFLLVLLCITIVSALAITSVNADDKRIDMRELEEYGQQHYYLGAPASVAPNVEDAKVSENEYQVSYEFKIGDAYTTMEWDKAASGYSETEWSKVYMSYDNTNLYLAMEVKDGNYIKGSDGIAYNISFRDRGIGHDAISRMCFDIWQHQDSVEEDISTFKCTCRYLIKNAAGEWENPPAVDGLTYITDISGRYDESTQVFTVELEIYLKQMLDFWNNDLPLEDVRMCLYPFVRMYGESQKGAGDVINQGIIWNYLKVDSTSELASEFKKDYNYAPPWIPNIVHFCEDPALTTTAPATSQTPTTTTNSASEPLTSAPPVVTTDNATTAIETTVADQKGCGAAISAAVIPLALAGIACLVTKKKKD